MLAFTGALLAVIVLLAIDDVRIRMARDQNNQIDHNELIMPSGDGRFQGSAYVPDTNADMLPASLENMITEIPGNGSSSDSSNGDQTSS